MAAWHLGRVDFFGGRRVFEPELDLLAVSLEPELLDHLADEGALLVLDLEVGPGEGAHELHQAHTLVMAQVGERHGERVSSPTWESDAQDQSRSAIVAAL